MRYTTRFLRPLLVAALAAGCTASEGSTSADSELSGSATAQRELTAAEIGQAFQPGIGDYAFPERDELIATTRGELAELQSQIDRLAAQVERNRGTGRAGVDERLDVARTRWMTAKQAVDLAEGATEYDWIRFKSQVGLACADVRLALDEARQGVGDEIAPGDTGAPVAQQN